MFLIVLIGVQNALGAQRLFFQLLLKNITEGFSGFPDKPLGHGLRLNSYGTTLVSL